MSLPCPPLLPQLSEALNRIMSASKRGHIQVDVHSSAGRDDIENAIQMVNSFLKTLDKPSVRMNEQRVLAQQALEQLSAVQRGGVPCQTPFEPRRALDQVRGVT